MNYMSGKGYDRDWFPDFLEKEASREANLEQRVKDLERKVEWLESLLSGRIQLANLDTMEVIARAVEIQRGKDRE